MPYTVRWWNDYTPSAEPDGIETYDNANDALNAAMTDLDVMDSTDFNVWPAVLVGTFPNCVPGSSRVEVTEIDMHMVETVLSHYLEAAFWADLRDDDGEPLDHAYDRSDLAPEAEEQARREVLEFVTMNADKIAATGADLGQTGHDFWLTRNHHGAGFWDRGYGEPGEALTKAAHAYGELTIYVGDDGKVYFL